VPYEEGAVRLSDAFSCTPLCCKGLCVCVCVCVWVCVWGGGYRMHSHVRLRVVEALLYCRSLFASIVGLFLPL
jgi:hypothetical protein